MSEKRLLKGTLIAIVVLVLPLIVLQNCNSNNDNATDTSSMIFHDEFDGAELDETKWNKHFRWGDIIINDELQAYVDDGFVLKDGILRIKCERRDAEYDNQTMHYTSGVITSQFKHSYGYFEIRCKMPEAGKGLWPAFWLMQDQENGTQGIVILEWYSVWPDKIEMTFQVLNSSKDDFIIDTRWYEGPDFTQDFHTFAVDWRENSIVWYIDGIERFRYDGQTRGEVMYVIVNLAIASKDPAGPPDDNTTFPCYFDIDYVRVYNKR